MHDTDRRKPPSLVFLRALYGWRAVRECITGFTQEHTESAIRRWSALPFWWVRWWGWWLQWWCCLWWLLSGVILQAHAQREWVAGWAGGGWEIYSGVVVGDLDGGWRTGADGGHNSLRARQQIHCRITQLWFTFCELHKDLNSTD